MQDWIRMLVRKIIKYFLINSFKGISLQHFGCSNYYKYEQDKQKAVDMDNLSMRKRREYTLNFEI